MSMGDDPPRIHQVSCSLVSGPDGTAGFALAQEIAGRVARYARRLGLAVMEENVDTAEPEMPISTICAEADRAEDA